MKKIDFIWLGLFSSLILLSLSYFPNRLYDEIEIIKYKIDLFVIKPLTLFLVGITGVYYYILYRIKSEFKISQRLKHMILAILAILSILYFFEFLWHFAMAFSIFVINKGTLPIDSINVGGMFNEIFWAKINLFLTLWALLAIYTIYGMKESKTTN